MGFGSPDDAEGWERVDEHQFGVGYILTGWGQEADRQSTRSAGMDHHLVKPIGIDALQEVLERVNRQGSLRSG
jgi:CheY-like chemotaxis protein